MKEESIRRRIVGRIRRSWTLREWSVCLAEWFAPDRVMVLDEPLTPGRRWDRDHPHPGLYRILNANRAVYERHLRSFLALAGDLVRIPRDAPQNEMEPYWKNRWMPGLDSVALYGFVATSRPRRYIEVGSGNSTKFARRAITDHQLNTYITSIDPYPRASVDAICDKVIRRRAESVAIEVFDTLEANDILYIDGSHRVLMNSDVTAIFLDVLPRLKPGVLVEVHDVFLPYDYLGEWSGRWYSEQYLLAMLLLAESSRYEIVMPNCFVKDDDELKEVLAPLWSRPEMQGVDRHGCSFWMRTR